MRRPLNLDPKHYLPYRTLRKHGKDHVKFLSKAGGQSQISVVPDEIGAVLVLGQQQLLLRLDALDLAKVPPSGNKTKIKSRYAKKKPSDEMLT